MESKLLTSILLLQLLGRANLRSLGSECIYVQDMVPKVPEVPQYLLQRTNTDLCRGTEEGVKALQCDISNIFIKRECLCTFHQVSNKDYNNYTACDQNEKSDSILHHLTCPQCKNYSINNTGPCLNGGTLTCQDHGKLMVHGFDCECLEGFTGKFCEYERKTLYRICVPSFKHNNLPTCSNDIHRDTSCSIQFNNNTHECSSTSQQGDIICNKNGYSFPQSTVSNDSATSSLIVCVLTLITYQLFLRCFVETVLT